MRQGHYTVTPPAWRSWSSEQERRAGFSRDDLERYGVHMAAAGGGESRWYGMPVERMRETLAPADPPAAGSAGSDRQDPSAQASWQATEPAAGWSIAAGSLPLRGSFRDFRAALRIHLTGLSADALADEGLPQPILLDKVGAVAAAAFHRGELGVEALQYHVRSPAGFGAYRLSETLLAELGYYRRPRRRSPDPGAAGAPFAGGHFTGLRGIWSAEDLLPPAVQERLLLEAMAWNLRKIGSQLPPHLSLADLLGLPLSAGGGTEGGERLLSAAPRPASCLTLSGMLAAAQIHGAEAAAAALWRPADMPRDRMVRTAMRQFGGFATPFEAPLRPRQEEVEHLLAAVRRAVAERFGR